MIRILIVDDHWMFRNGLRGFIEEDTNLVVIGESNNGEEAVEMARRLHPDIILMDAHLPTLDGIAVTSIICKELPGTNVMVLSTQLHGYMILEAIKAGASGYILKNASPSELHSAIQTLIERQTYLSSEAFESLIQEIRRPHDAIVLTGREKEVLQLLAEGHSNKGIMLKLDIKEDTVKSHVRHIFSKLGAGTRTQAVLTAIHIGLIASPFQENKLLPEKDITLNNHCQLGTI